MIIENKCRICGSEENKVLREFTLTRPDDPIESLLDNEALSLNRQKVYCKLFFDLVIKSDKKKETLCVYKCLNCSFIYYTPCPDDFEMKMKYTHLSSMSSNVKPDKRSMIRMKKRQRFMCNLIKSVPEFTSKCKILDYGGQNGELIQPLANESDCFVVDYSTNKKYNNITYITGNYKNVSQRFDIVLLSHVLEHISDPVKYLKNLRGLLKEDGALIIIVPFGAFKEYNDFTNPFLHVNFFSEKSLFKCIKKSKMIPVKIHTKYIMTALRKNWCIICMAKKTDNQQFVEAKPRKGNEIQKIYYWLPYMPNWIRGKIISCLPIKTKDYLKKKVLKNE